MARGLRTVGLALAGLLLTISTAGCDIGAPNRMSAKIAARQARLNPPQFWQVAQLAPNGVVEAQLKVCVEPLHVAGFLRPAAEVNGRPCITYGPLVDTDRLYASGCRVDGEPFRLRISNAGDPATSFETWFSLTPARAPSLAPTQHRRYRRLGACPAGWPVGRQEIVAARPS